MHAEENPQRVTKASLSFDIWPFGGLGVGRVLGWRENLCVGLGGQPGGWWLSPIELWLHCTTDHAFGSKRKVGIP